MEEVPECQEYAMADLEAFDTEQQDNQLSYEEFEFVYLYYFGEDGNDYHRDYLFTLYDVNHDHMLSLDEFKELYCNEVHDGGVVTVCADWSEPLFTAYDADQSGNLDQTEFAILYDTFCPCNKDLEELFTTYDTNNDGVLDLDEYSLLLCIEL
jgi:Ca2+-binding EF-hand superfamily protein